LTFDAKPGTLFTTEDVLTEYLNYFAGWGSYFRSKASSNVQNILKVQTVQIIPSSHGSFLDGLELYRARIDKGYSLTDCISMQAMRREGVNDVLTDDRHFEQEGFQVLFRNPDIVGPGNRRTRGE
jgi:predicted nucleic acid-binding protein